MVKAKPYVGLFLRALKDASVVDKTVEGMLLGILKNAPLETTIETMNMYENSVKIMIEKIVQYYNKFKEEGKI